MFRKLLRQYKFLHYLGFHNEDCKRRVYTTKQDYLLTPDKQILLKDKDRFNIDIEKPLVGIIKYAGGDFKKGIQLVSHPTVNMSLLQMERDYIELLLNLLQLNMNTKETKKNIIQAGQKAVDELIKVAKEPIVDSDDDISADRLKNAAATKKLAIFDAFEILTRIQEEENLLEGKIPEERKEKVFKGFAEGRSK